MNMTGLGWLTAVCLLGCCLVTTMSVAQRQGEKCKIMVEQRSNKGREQLLTAELRAQVRTLTTALEEAERKHRPKDGLRAIDRLGQIAERQQALATMLCLVELRYEFAEQIDADEARSARGSAYERIAQLPWLSVVDRSLVRIHQLRYYAGDYEQVRYDLAALRPSLGGEAETFPYKTAEGYLRQCGTLLDEVERLAPLGTSTEGFAPWAELDGLKRRYSERAWTGTLAAELFGGRQELSGLLGERIQTLLEQYVREAATPTERMHTEWYLLKGKKSASAADFLAFLARYEQRAECFPYLISALDRAYQRHGGEGKPRLYVAHVERLLALPYLDKIQQEQLRSVKQRLTVPSLFANLRSSATVPSRRQTQIIVHHAFVPSVKVEAFRVPQIFDSTERWQPKQSDKPDWAKTFALEQDLDWRNKRDTLRLGLHRTGYYCLRISSPQHKKLQEQLLYLSVTNRVAYQPPQGLGAARVQWLDATTGAPLVAQACSVWEQAWSDENRRRAQCISTDALGFVSLPLQAKQYDYQWGVGLEDREDPIFTYLYGGAEEPQETQRTDITLTTDRAVYAEGQTLHLYGYIGRQERQIEAAHTLEGVELELVLISPNGQDLTKRRLTSDAYGRFTMDYAIPRGILLGTHTIVCRRHDGGQGYATAEFRVEAYQKPTFDLLATPPSTALRLGDSVRIPISVHELTGAPLGGVRLEAQTTIKHYRWWYWSVREQAQQLPLVQLTSDKDGRASLPLVLSPIEQDEPQERPAPFGSDFYTYHINLRATAPSGETQEQSLSFSIGRELAKVVAKMPEYIERNSLEGELTFESHAPSGNAISQVVVYTITREGKGERALRTGQAETNRPIVLKPLLQSLPSGRYTLSYKPLIEGEQEQKLEEHSFRLFASGDKTLGQARPLELFAPSVHYERGTLPEVYYGTSLDSSYIYCQVKCDEKLLPTQLLRPTAGQLCRLPLKLVSRQPERIGVLLWLVREGHIMQERLDFTRRTPSRELTIEVKSFRDRTTPGANEEISVQISQEGRPVRAALAAWMYDEALEQIVPLSPRPLRASPLLPTPITEGRALISASNRDVDVDMPYAMEVATPLYGYASAALRGATLGLESASVDEVVVAAAAPKVMRMSKSSAETNTPIRAAVRGDFAETAFFRPMLETDAKGEVRWTYRVPDNLTRWRLCLLAHTQALGAGYQTKTIEVYRPLMLKPFLPRLLRLGDKTNLAVGLRSEADKPSRGRCVLELFAPQSGRVLHRTEQSFDLEPKEQKALHFDLTAPSGLDSVGIRLVATAGRWSDGEQYILRIEPDVQQTVRSQSITLERVGASTLSLEGLFPTTGFVPEEGRIDVRLESHPLLLALESLPTAAQPSHKDAISLSVALYSHAISRKVLKIPGLTSWLEARLAKVSGKGLRNERDSLLLASEGDSPWSGILAEEAEYKRIEELKNYFDHIDTDGAAVTKDLIGDLTKLQNADGSWSWYPGMRPSPFVTLSVMRQLVRAHRLEQMPELASILGKGWQALVQYLRAERKDMLEYERKHRGSRARLSGWVIDCLYLAALDDGAASAASRELVGFFYERLRKEAHTLPLTLKPTAAVALMHRDSKLALELLESLRQHLSSRDSGLHYANLDARSYWWLNRAYPMQTATIEALLTLAPEDIKIISGLQRWLLEQKRSVRWESSLATSEAIYALSLGHAPSTLSEVRSARLELTDSKGECVKVEGERPSIERNFTREDYPKSLKVTTTGQGVVWGVASARYRLPITQETPSGVELRATRHYYRRTEVDGKPQLAELIGGEELAVGDILVVRLEIELERAMDFVRLSDPRLLCAEGRDLTSGYIYSPQARVSYYIEHRDEATNFYFDQLDRGRYTLEYEQSVVRSGVYQAVSAHLQSVYAPEYTATTGYGGQVKVKP